MAVETGRLPVGAVTARSASVDGSYEEEIGNCLLWSADGRVYTLGDLHTVMAGAEAASDHVADQIVVRVGRRTSRARVAWPPEGRRDCGKMDIAILDLEDGVVAESFDTEAFAGSAAALPTELYLAAPGHRPKVIRIGARAVAYGSQWFIDRELSRGDSGGMLFALEDGRVVPYGFVSSIGSLPGGSARGTVLYGRDAMRISIQQFLRTLARPASWPAAAVACSAVGRSPCLPEHFVEGDSHAGGQIERAQLRVEHREREQP
jgi:hypothetical protein